ncbi:FtsX-like permease family protein [Dactylosporangium sp. NPDC051484]|uniref:ABC transporter permease n=1 Tax=Dactylosporangium sp. NPDC051484 TaxID=3154942 RepID=UPI0034504942
MTGGLGRVVRSGVGRRRVQTVVMTLTTLLAVTASVLAVGLLVASSEPFARAFSRQHGAHLAAQFDAGKVTAEQLSATAHAAGVTAAAGPFPTVDLRPRTATAHPSGPPAGIDLPPVTIVGRPGPGGDVDRLELTAGRWATGPGEMVWAADDFPFEIGDEFAFPGAPGAPKLKVVGHARSVGRTGQIWASPATVAALTAPGGGGFQMLYRFTNAATDADVNAGRAVIEAAIPPGALLGAASYLRVKTDAEHVAATFAPFVVAFGALGLAMSVLIIGIVVSGAVSSATRRIGILKALGYTPAQVARAYVGQALIPATIGALIGIPLGNLAAIPVLREEGDAFGTGAATLDWWVSAVVPLAALAAVAATAFVPALRAGRLRTVAALAVGRTPSAGHGASRAGAARHLLGRLPLPRPMSLGLANPFTRPGRSATIAAAVALGALGVTFGTGLALSVGGVQSALNRRDAGDVMIYLAGVQEARISRPGAPAPPTPDPAAVEAAVKAQPGTARYFVSRVGEVTVAGITGMTEVVTFDGDASWGTYEIIAGRWFAGPGEAVVPSAFLDAAGVKIGDTLTLRSEGRTATVRIVGEVLDLSSDGRRVITDVRSVAGLNLTDTRGGGVYHVDLADGTDLKAYTSALNAIIEDKGGHAEVNAGEISGTVVAIDTLAGTLTLLLVAVAGLGVLNTVVLDTRERVHELGVFKALGMAPRQTVAMVLTSVAGIGLLAGLVGVPAGIVLHDWVLPRMGHAAGTRFPPHILRVYDVALLVPLALGGLVIALAGALLPAGWAARTSTARALRTE